MRVLWLFAHPEQRSLSGALRDEGLASLTEENHEYALSDLYAMGWNPVVSGEDYAHDPQERLVVGTASTAALETGRLSADIRWEQEKLTWADTVIVQFPLWWYGMPAILKGWFDRVLVKGFGFGITDEQGCTLRYGQGPLAGKRAMVVVSAGARSASLGPRGINGELNDLLFPIQHGTLWYTGMQVLPPMLVPGADRMGEAGFADTADALRRRVLAIPQTTPLAFRYQNHGDYDADMVLRTELGTEQSGLRVHYGAAPWWTAPSSAS
ncbi:NAD(P)H-dependent oxidoreductase [Lipingzhangella sp. LS1_29]|uniref:NAD(P)H-dependent oxidoreductase n=1 Tax=Lipingzhangella rawalii TaxID=2055835 RepID=A0ABU2H8T8_9ACTN|nr:NAD(P)H-dependent oxidoreductase [Lipingzhangella rawalii]MDS1271721.1 NAD(P)H-dependent oxidoreductase [Lipingzhangella rawalii]